ncbi:dihydroorotate dehydrogenase electron transfer subunit [Planctomycetes bacterium K23_9]|uniref:Dihydroorotate dehydrogenase B (NAD(+)), electron transfer subunit n=1 Tax=Stieleria marina TaxID=1930275 RepID=A0A517NYR7_9BACT|nr:Dihydroorotate dehydrogenase B (NAD(+)), electron transfer subunit [Planctomycetes bacterium K23_9]
MSKLHADFYADAMTQVEAVITEQQLIAEETYRVRVSAASIASTAVPGQFVMIRLASRNSPLIGRALAIYDVIDDSDGKPRWIDLVYIRKGTLTQALAASPLGTQVTLWGPLGNGFSDRPCDRLIMVAGGIGQTPMLLLGREALGNQTFGDGSRQNGWASQVELIYGARRESLLAGVDDFRNAGFGLTLCTDDGSVGEQRLAPDVLAERLSKLTSGETVRVATCGPEIMMQKVAEICATAGVDCQVSMETPMACGIGICFSCVAPIKMDAAEQDGSEGWDYKRTCVEGPIFDADKICWH